MTDSSENGSDFINGLKELGLYNDNIMNDDDKSSEIKKKKKTKKSASPKKKPPKRKPISIDEIMKNMDIPIHTTADSLINSTSVVEKKEQTTEIPPSINNIIDTLVPPFNTVEPSIIPQKQPQLSLNIIENNLTDYLNRSLRMIKDEFSIEISQLFTSDSEIDEIVASFLETVKQSIREEINFSLNPKTSMTSFFEPFAPKFRDLYQDIERFRNNSIPEKVMELRNANNAISSYIPTIHSQFSHTEVTNELNELNTLRTKYRISRARQFQFKRSLFLSQLDLECQNEAQKLDADLLQTRLQRLENEREKIDAFDDPNERNTITSMGRKLSHLSHDLSILIHKKSDSKKSIHMQKIKEVCNELNYIRQLHMHQIELLYSRLNDMNQQSTQFMYTQSLNSPANKPSPLTHSPKRVQQSRVHNRKNSSSKINETTKTEITDPNFLSKIQEQLRTVQEKNESNLNNTSKFLHSLKKKERKRIHRQVTKIFDSDYDLNLY